MLIVYIIRFSIKFSKCANSITIPQYQVESFVFEATSKHSYSIDQGLAMLFWNKYDIAKSLADLHEYVPLTNEWTREDKVLFEQAFMFHGKNFNKIRQVVRKRTCISLPIYNSLILTHSV
jgi:hypothetical protein